MKKFIFLLTMLSCCALSAKEQGNLKRIYIDPNQILILEDGLFISHEEETIPVQFVGYDELGYYAAPLYWVCVEGHINSLLNWPVCKKCQKGPRPGP